MSKIELITRWIWRPQSLSPQIFKIIGGNMPQRIRQELTQNSPPQFEEGTGPYETAKTIAHGLSKQLPDPEPIDLGGDSLINGTITGLQYLNGNDSNNIKKINLSYYMEYENGQKTEGGKSFFVDKLEEPFKEMVHQLHRDINTFAKEYFWENCGKGKMDPKKWKSEKKEVFISYRPFAYDIAKQLFNVIGEYGDSAVFIPRLDRIDLQAGNWMKQLML